MPSKMIKADLYDTFFYRNEFKEKKWLLVAPVTPHKSNILSHVKCLCQALDNLNATYESLTLIGDFNVESN